MKIFPVLLALLLCLPFARAAENDSDPMIAMDMKIFSDEVLVSEPAVAFRPGSDASVMQGIDGGLVLRVVFHSIHMSEEGAEMLVDVDFGVDEPEHMKARHVMMPWNEAYVVDFSPALDAPGIRFEATPSKATQADFMMRRKKVD